MLRGGNQHAFFHQACGVTHARHVATDSLNLKVIEVGAAEDNSSACRSRQNPQLHWSAAVQALAQHSTADRIVCSCFKLSCYLLFDEEITAQGRTLAVAN